MLIWEHVYCLSSLQRFGISRPDPIIESGMVRSKHPALTRPVAPQDGVDRLQQDQQIEPETGVFQVVQVVPQFLSRTLFGVGVGIANLRPAGETGLAQVPQPVERNRRPQLGHVVRPFRARPDQTHLAAQHVDPLGQFVDAGFPQEPANPRDAGIVGLSEPSPPASHRPAWCGT